VALIFDGLVNPGSAVPARLGMRGHVRIAFLGNGYQPTTTKVVSKIAASGTVRVIAGQEFSFEKNVTGERNDANPES
jgi:hypothetical protein